MPETPPASAASVGDLPALRAAIKVDDIIARLRQASKRGRLAGFEQGQLGALFGVSAFGRPFDAVLLGDATPADAGCELRFRLHQPRKMPAVFALILLATIWPGVYFTDQLIPGEWGWIPTWWWYLPITIIPTPWLWRSTMRKSRAEVERSAMEAIQKIARELDATLVPGGTP